MFQHSYSQAIYQMTINYNKDKSGILKISKKSNELTQKEKNTISILDLLYYTHYEYLGIILNKNLNPNKHIEKLKLKLKKFKHLNIILRLQGVNQHIIIKTWVIFALYVINYGCFIFLLLISNQS